MSKSDTFIKNNNSGLQIIFWSCLTGLLIFPLTDSHYMNLMEKAIPFNYLWLLYTLMVLLSWIDKPIQLIINYAKRRKLNVR